MSLSPRLPRRLPRISPLAALAFASALGSVCAIWVASGVGFLPEEPLLDEIEELPERFVYVDIDGHRPATEPRGAIRFSVPRSDADMLRAKGEHVELGQRQIDKELASSAGTLGPMIDGSKLGGLTAGSGLGGDVIGGLIGNRGVGHGLGVRGSGTGGGGSSMGIAPFTAEEAAVSELQRKQADRGEVAERSLLLGMIGTRGEVARPGGGTEQYTDHGVNPMTITERDSQSTFSIDVDTASYAIARRKLQGGIMPPSASVRVEEFLNYLPYDYAAPRSGRPFAVHMEAAPNPYQPGHHLLRVGVKGRDLDQTHRAPVRLTFLVDVSGSMSSTDKLELAKDSLHLLVDQLGVEDSVAIATYAGRVTKVLEPTPTTRRSRIHAAIDSLRSGGSTAMNSGIDLAYDMARRAYVEGAENRVVVLSDGDANVGPSSHSQILDTIGVYAGRGISLSTIGFGMGNYKDTLMEQLADRGDGNYHYVDSMREAEKVFGQDLAGNLQTIARDVKIQVEFDPDAVLAYRLVGYENRDIADRDFRNDAVDAGEVGSGHRVTALYDVVLADEITGSIASVRLRAKPPGPDAPAAEWSTVFSSDALGASFASASADFRIAAGAAGFAEKLRHSRYMDEVSYRQIAAIVRSALRGHHEEDGELLELIGEAADLVGEAALAQR
jgi:Ca-activated chloride channel homolog